MRSPEEGTSRVRFIIDNDWRGNHYCKVRLPGDKDTFCGSTDGFSDGKREQGAEKTTEKDGSRQENAH